VTDPSPSDEPPAATATDAEDSRRRQTPPPPGGETGRPGKYLRTSGGLVGSIIAALGLIAAVWALTWFQHRDSPNPAPTVAYATQLSQARAAAPFTVLAPKSAPSGWRATSVSWDGTPPEYAWHLGFLTGSGSGSEVDYVGLEQSNADPTEFLPTATPADQPGPPVTIDGQTWQTLTSPDGETAIVLNGGDVTTVVTGTAPLDDLTAFAKTLSAG
jgi:hypothetical protein